MYNVTPSAGANGTITPNTVQSVAPGGNVTFTAAPASGYAVNVWKINGVAVQAGGAIFTVTNVTSILAVQVTFVALPSVAPPQTQAVLTSYFLTGLTPTQEQFAELIGTMFFLYNETVAAAAAAAAQANASGCVAAWGKFKYLSHTGTTLNIQVLGSYNCAISGLYTPQGGGLSACVFTATFTNPLPDTAGFFIGQSVPPTGTLPPTTSQIIGPAILTSTASFAFIPPPLGNTGYSPANSIHTFIVFNG